MFVSIYFIRKVSLKCCVCIYSLYNNIIIMEICKALTLRLKALNKHTHIMYIEMENVTKKKKKYISTSVQA